MTSLDTTTIATRRDLATGTDMSADHIMGAYLAHMQDVMMASVRESTVKADTDDIASTHEDMMKVTGTRMTATGMLETRIDTLMTMIAISDTMTTTTATGMLVKMVGIQHTIDTHGRMNVVAVPTGRNEMSATHMIPFHGNGHDRLMIVGVLSTHKSEKQNLRL